MNRTAILNFIADTIGAQTYLEIGVNNGTNLANIRVAKKTGVDPGAHAQNTSHRMTSDQFFERNNETFDLIFIDGLHHSDQVERDIANSLKALTKHGAIVLHDCNPPNELSAMREAKVICWCGDVYRGWIKFRSTTDLVTFTIDSDLGCGVILNTKGAVPFEVGDLSWSDFSAKKRSYLGLVSVDEAVQRLKDGY